MLKALAQVLIIPAQEGSSHAARYAVVVAYFMRVNDLAPGAGHLDYTAPKKLNLSSFLSDGSFRNFYPKVARI